MDFLTKDMGEDRWLCTLMVLRGWQLEYAASAENITYCPTDFNEFFNQRRRWVPSTVANIMELLGEWRTATSTNDNISIVRRRKREGKKERKNGWMKTERRRKEDEEEEERKKKEEEGEEEDEDEEEERKKGRRRRRRRRRRMEIHGNVNQSLFSFSLSLSLSLSLAVSNFLSFFFVRPPPPPPPPSSSCSWSKAFIIYEVAMLFSTLVSPATVLLVMIGGLSYGTKMSLPAVEGILISISGLYVVICLLASKDFQLLVAKILTFLFAIIMGIVAIGVAVEIGDEVHKSHMHPPAPSNHSNHTGNHTNVTWFPDDLRVHPTGASWDVTGEGQPSTLDMVAPTTIPLLHNALAKSGLSVSTIYLAAMGGMFVMAGVLHPNEAFALVHGIWYLLCLPGGYLFLTIYSFTNLDDRSWGTREEKVKKAASGKVWYQTVLSGCGRVDHEPIWHFFGRLLCCRRTPPDFPAPKANAEQVIVVVAFMFRAHSFAFFGRRASS